MDQISKYPNDEEMSDRCVCGHTLGCHAYGSDAAPCDNPYPHGCTCHRFESLHDGIDARAITSSSFGRYPKATTDPQPKGTTP